MSSAAAPLARSLIAEDLLDRLNLYLYPVVFGASKRLFDGTVPAAFRLAEPPVAFPKGAVSLLYERAREPVTGSPSTAEPVGAESSQPSSPLR